MTSVGGVEQADSLLEQLSLSAQPSRERRAAVAMTRLLEAPTGELDPRYAVLEPVGSGGMGSVWLAWDRKLRRRVAIKRIARRTSHALARFAREAQLLAQLNHPNVVQVFDVEIEAADPYLVMEYVAGRDLATHVRQADPSTWRARLDLMLRAGAGLAAAHRLSIVHRDFKPANVMVADTGETKVLDFGLARASSEAESSDHDAGSPANSSASSPQGPPSPHATVTDSNTVVGTLAYLAPELLAGQARADARSDQFSFCVSLWEVMTQVRPFAGRSTAALLEAMEAGPRESAKVPAWIRSAVLRGLARDPAERWPTMDALLEAIDPARRDRRRRILSFAALGVLSIGSLAATQQHAPEPCQGAQTALDGIWDPGRRATLDGLVSTRGGPAVSPGWARVADQLDAYGDDWQAMHHEACAATRLRGEQSEAAMDLRMACLHEARRDLRSYVDAVSEADAGQLAVLGDPAGVLVPLPRCADLDVLRTRGAEPDASEREAVEALRDLVSGSKAALATGRLAEALELADEAAARSGEVRYGPIGAQIALVRGKALSELSEPLEARAALSDAVAKAARWNMDAELSDAVALLMPVVSGDLGAPAEAMAMADLLRGLAEQDPARLPTYHCAMAAVHFAGRRLDQAKASAEQCTERLDADDDADPADRAGAHNNLAVMLRILNERDRARSHLETALAIIDAQLGPLHPSGAMVRANRSVAFSLWGNPIGGEIEARLALELTEPLLGPDHRFVQAARGALALSMTVQGRHDEAELAYRASLEAAERTYRPGHLRIARVLHPYATASIRAGRHEQGRALLQRAIDIELEALGPEHAEVEQLQTLLAKLDEGAQ